MGFFKKLFPDMKSKYKWLSILLAVSILLILSIILFLNTNFLLVEDVIVRITPGYIPLSLERSEAKEVSVNFEVENHWLCSSECSYELRSVSDNNILKNDSFIVNRRESFNFKHNFSASEYGSGQDIYYFKVECNNIRTEICRATSPTKSRASVVTLNYEPNYEDKLTLEILRNNLEDVIFNYQISYKNFLQSNYLLENTVLELDYNISSYDNLISINNSLTKVLTLWPEQNIDLLNNKLNNSFVNATNNTRVNLTNIKENVLSNINKYNEIIDNLNIFKENNVLLNNIIRDPFERLLINFENDVNYLTSILNEGERRFSIINFEYANIEHNYNHSFESYKNNVFKSRGYLLDVYLLRTSLCIYNNETNCFYEQYNIENLTLNETIELKNSVCEATNLLDNINNINQSNDDERYKVLSSLLMNYEDNTTNVYEKYLNETVSNVGLEEDYYPLNYNTTMTNEYLAIPDGLIERVRFLKSNCEGNITLQDLNVTKDNVTLINITIPNIEIPETVSKCCAYGNCTSCLTKPERNPVIFLHGHSVYPGNSPEYSSDGFNRIINKLEDDQHYIRGNLLTPTREEKELIGDLGRNKPFMFKATYYYTTIFDGLGYITTISKSENIDTYAIRLDEIITWTKQATNADQVDIVAHSMGGLVARRYLQVFDDNSVENLIMIGTPNHGITNQVYNACSLIGDTRECRDMRIDSDFLNALNDPSFETNTNLFTITGRGCNMAGEDGDGIVTFNSVSIEGVPNYYVNGTCDGGVYLHTRLLNPERHPKIYDVLKEILI